MPAQAAGEPAVGPLGRARGVVTGDVERRAFVERECDVRVQRGLHRHRALRPQEALLSVQVGAEAHTVFGDRQDRAGALPLRAATLDLFGNGPMSHREHLKSARVTDHRPLPPHERPYAAEILDKLSSRRQEEMERVRQHHLVAQRLYIAGLQPLDRALGRQRHEARRPHRAAPQLQHPRSCKQAVA